MEQVSPSNRMFARFVSPLSNYIKRVATAISVFTDTDAYKDKIARYESEIQYKSGCEIEPALTNAAEERQPATP